MQLAIPYYYVLALCLGAGLGTDPTIQVDGNFSDWPNGKIATADQRYIYFLRIDLPVLMNLQKCKDSITIEVDFDNDQKTGRSIRSEKPPGVDIEFVFSPPSQDGDGAAIITYVDSGKPTKRSHSVIGLIHAPTHAAKSFVIKWCKVRRQLHRWAHQRLRHIDVV